MKSDESFCHFFLEQATILLHRKENLKLLAIRKSQKLTNYIFFKVCIFKFFIFKS